VFSLSRSAIRDVVVHGRWVVRDQQHPQQDEIVSRYRELHEKVWVDAGRTR
jgi:formimidoylglutamate deiminase